MKSYASEIGRACIICRRPVTQRRENIAAEELRDRQCLPEPTL